MDNCRDRTFKNLIFFFLNMFIKIFHIKKKQNRQHNSKCKKKQKNPPQIRQKITLHQQKYYFNTGKKQK